MRYWEVHGQFRVGFQVSSSLNKVAITITMLTTLHLTTHEPPSRVRDPESSLGTRLFWGAGVQVDWEGQAVGVKAEGLYKGCYTLSLKFGWLALSRYASLCFSSSEPIA